MKSPLPPDHYLKKKAETVKLKKKDGEKMVRYFLSGEELKMIEDAYSGRRFYDGPGPRRSN